MLKMACAQTVEWQRQYGLGEDLTISVNFSARHLADESIVALVGDVLADTGLPAKSLKTKTAMDSGFPRATCSPSKGQPLHWPMASAPVPLVISPVRFQLNNSSKITFVPLIPGQFPKRQNRL